MISAKLIKDLEQRGFGLDFPGYSSLEEEIIEILRAKNERLLLALPLLLQQEFDYVSIKRKIRRQLLQRFNHIILLSSHLFRRAGVAGEHLQKIIKAERITGKISPAEFDYYFKALQSALQSVQQDSISRKMQSVDMRRTLDMNKALAILFAPAKIRIMEKIFNHEKLSNTELKYYYRAIRPIIAAIGNKQLQDYVQSIEGTKKYNQ